MRYTIETAPKNGNIVILEDDESGFLEVAHWSPEGDEWIRENGEPIQIQPSHWHPCYSFYPFSSSDAPKPRTVDEVIAPRSAAAVETPLRAQQGFAIPPGAAKIVAAMFVGICLLQAVLHAHALNEERARSSVLESELRTARQTGTTGEALSDDTTRDSVSSPKPEGGLREISEPENNPIETAAPKPRDMNSRCRHYRTYDPASETYKGYDGQRHPCPQT